MTARSTDERSGAANLPHEPDLYLIDVPEDRFVLLEGTTLSYAPIDDLDAYALRDARNKSAGEIRLPATTLRKLAALI